MKNKLNPTKIDKKIIRLILIVIVLVIFITLLITLNSLLGKKKPSLDNIGYSFAKSNSDLHRKITIESKAEGIFNLGEYRVNITPDKLLTLDLSIKCTDDAYSTLLKNNILLQNAVISAFDMYGGIHFLDTPSGKDRLKDKIKQNMYEALGKPLVKEIYFKKYLIH